MKIKVFILSVVFLLLLGVGAIAWLLLTAQGARFAVKQAISRTIGSENVSWTAIQGSLMRGIRVKNLELREMPKLPAESVLRIQQLFLQLESLTPDGLVANVEHGRLFIQPDEAVIFNVRVKGKRFTANAFGRVLGLSDVKEFLSGFFKAKIPPGTLRQVDLDANGSLNEFRITGDLIIERIKVNQFVLSEAPVDLQLVFKRAGSGYEMTGPVSFSGGVLEGNSVKIQSRQSRLTFTGRPRYPELNVQATSRIGKVEINIAVKGTRADPVLVLTSDEDIPKEELLLMLATGRRWSGVSRSTEQGTMSPQLKSDFVNYLLFGGSRGEVIKWFGLSDISVSADEKSQGVTLRRDITDKLDVGYGVKVTSSGPESGQQREMTQTVDTEYRLNSRLLLGVQKELKPENTDTFDETIPSGEGDPPDDRIYMKYRVRF